MLGGAYDIVKQRCQRNIQVEATSGVGWSQQLGWRANELSRTQRTGYLGEKRLQGLKPSCETGSGVKKS